MSGDGDKTLPGISSKRQRSRAISAQARVNQVDLLLMELDQIHQAAGDDQVQRIDRWREVLTRELARAHQLGQSMGTTAVEEAQALARSEQTLRQRYELQLHDLRFALVKFLRGDIDQAALRELVHAKRETG